MPSKLIIFDVDGTLVERDTVNFLPGVRAYFDQHRAVGTCKFALASNQGGVGLRHWMESGGFGEPSKYPTELNARLRIDAVAKMLLGGIYIAKYICFAYQSYKTGKWSPLPDGISPDNCEWNPEYRKPAPGMLIRAMREAPATPDETLFVGDFEADQKAAEAAGCHFQWAHEFFGRPVAQEG